MEVVLAAVLLQVQAAVLLERMAADQVETLVAAVPLVVAVVAEVGLAFIIVPTRTIL